MEQLDLLKGVLKTVTTQEYQQPGIPGVKRLQISRFTDDSGSFTELARVNPQASVYWANGDFGGSTEKDSGYQWHFKLAQINYSELEPGGIKALHLHYKQTDLWFVPPSDKYLVVLYDCRLHEGQTGFDRVLVRRLVLGDGRSELLWIPPGVAHGCKNMRDTIGRLIYFVDQTFDPNPDRCDEHRLPWDFLGRDVWEPIRG